MMGKTDRSIRLEEISDFDMAYCELSEDNLFDFIPVGKRKQYIRQSMGIAADMAVIYKDEPIHTLFQEYEVAVVFHQEETTGAIHSQIRYDGKIKKVDIYMSVLTDLEKAMQSIGYEVTLDELVNLHLAHEFYHFLEFYHDCRTYEQLEPLTYRVFGFIKRTAAVRRTSEISAHMFAKQVSRFPIHPKILDYILLENQRQEKDILFHKLEKIHAEQDREVSI